MKSILFICPYFGKLPEDQMTLWLRSCEYNDSINWVIFTDDHTEYDYPNNVKVIYTSLIAFKELLQKKFEFEISLENPYKLCDYKPVYGYVLDDIVKEYDFWGHCDISDCIFGDLRLYFTESILEKNEKILFLGHMTLYKNSKDVNERIFIPTSSNSSVETILSSSSNKAFDELNSSSINTIYNENGYHIQRIDDMYSDISPLRYSFQCSRYDKNFKQYYEKKEKLIFGWIKGKLFEYRIRNGEISVSEKGYVHFQKRKMKGKIGDLESYLITPEGFIEFNGEITIQIIKKYSKERLFYKKFFELKFEALKYHIRKIFGVI